MTSDIIPGPPEAWASVTVGLCVYSVAMDVLVYGTGETTAFSLGIIAAVVMFAALERT